MTCRLIKSRRTFWFKLQNITGRGVERIDERVTFPFELTINIFVKEFCYYDLSVGDDMDR